MIFFSITMEFRVYDKANWDFMSTFLSSKLPIFKDQISNLICFGNLHTIDIINNVVIIIPDIIIDIFKHVPENAININPFHPNVSFLYPLKMSQNFWFSRVFGRYRKDVKRVNKFTIPYNIQLLMQKNNKNWTSFQKIRNLFIKLALNSTPKQIKKELKSSEWGLWK